MKNLKNSPALVTAKKVLDICGLPDMLMLRIFAAFFLVSGLIIRSFDKNILHPLKDSKVFIEQNEFGSVVLYTLIALLVLTALYAALPKKFKFTDPFCTIFAVLFFDWQLLYGNLTHRVSFDSETVNMYAPIAVALVSVVVVAYAAGKIKNFELFEKGKWWIYGIVAFVAAFVMILYISVTTICHHYMFSTAAVDFGLFVQSFNSLADNLTAMNTCERDMLMSHFNVHASYIFYLFVPVFKIFPYEETLFVLQAIGAMGGIVPMVLILKNRNFKGISMLCFSLAYVFSICLIAPCFYDFHENAFLPTLLMWTLWAMDTKRYIPFYIFAALVCIVKEDAPLYIIFMGLYLFFERKGDIRRLHGLVAVGVSFAYMMFITQWLTANGDGDNMLKWRFGHLMLEGDDSMTDVLVNCLRNPGYFFTTFVTGATLPFFVQVMLPLLFMPFFTKKIHRFLLMLPFVITNLVVGAYYQYAGQISFQYIFGPGAMLIYMAVANVDDMSENTRKRIPIIIFAASVIFYAGYGSSGVQYYKNYHEFQDYYDQMDETLDRIPEGTVIGGNSVYLAHLCDREQVYLLNTNDLTPDQKEMLEPYFYDFIVLRNTDVVYKNAVAAAGYTLWDASGSLEIYKNPAYVG